MAAITSIPTLMLFRDGVLLFNQAGALPPQALSGVIEQARERGMRVLLPRSRREPAAIEVVPLGPGSLKELSPDELGVPAPVMSVVLSLVICTSLMTTPSSETTSLPMPDPCSTPCRWQWVRRAAGAGCTTAEAEAYFHRRKGHHGRDGAPAAG